MMLSRVVLPMPFSPTNAILDWGGMVRFNPLKISTEPYDLDKPEVVISDINPSIFNICSKLPGKKNRVNGRFTWLGACYNRDHNKQDNRELL